MEQVREYVRSRGPLDEACEVLLYRAALEGRLPGSSSAWINEAFAEPQPFAAPSEAWQQLYDDLGEESTQASGYVRAMSSMTKGGRIGATIDPRPMLEAIQRIQGDVLDRPRDPRAGASPIAKALDKVRSSLPNIVKTEAERELNWLNSYRLNLGELDGYAAFQSLILDLRQEALRCGIPFSRPAATTALDRLDKLAPINVDKEAAAVGSIGSDPTTVSLSQLAAPMRWIVIRDWEQAMPALKAMLDDIEASVGGASDVEEIAAAIETRKRQIDPLLTELITGAGELEAQQ
jgi:hypothetical protein